MERLYNVKKDRHALMRRKAVTGGRRRRAKSRTYIRNTQV